LTLENSASNGIFLKSSEKKLAVTAAKPRLWHTGQRLFNMLPAALPGDFFAGWANRL
jgi:hypothetical protein